MACLDTTFLIDLLRGNPNILTTKNNIEQTETRLCIAAPSIMELWFGSEISAQPAKEKAKIQELLQSLTILTLDERSAKLAGEIEATLTKQGEIIELEDIMIAAIALTHGESVVTRDSHYTRINKLRVIKY